MVVLYHPCPESYRLWGELWWVGGEHRWVFFDDLQNSDTYAEQVEYCPACGRPLERKNLRRMGTGEGGALGLLGS
jgi:hypothetical protein